MKISLGAVKKKKKKLKERPVEITKSKGIKRKCWVEIRPIESLRVVWKDKNGNKNTVIDIRSDYGGWEYLRKYCKEGGMKIIKKVRMK